jgi:aminoglycoside 3-N-acetyltransferase
LIIREEKNLQRTCLNDISKALSLIDLEPDPTVFMHSSLFYFGRLGFSVEDLIDLLLEWIGPHGTLAMPSFSYHSNKNLPWSALVTPGKTGVLTERFRIRPGVSRSVHPIHSISAYGKKAKFLTEDIETTSFGEKSPFSKLINMNAINVALGAQFLGGATFLHYAEELLKVPYREFIPLGVEVYDADELRVTNDFYYFARKLGRSQESMYVNDWDTPLKDFMDNNLLRFDRIKSANFMWARMGNSIDFLVDRIRKDAYYCAKEILNEK